MKEKEGRNGRDGMGGMGRSVPGEGWNKEKGGKRWNRGMMEENGCGKRRGGKGKSRRDIHIIILCSSGNSLVLDPR